METARRRLWHTFREYVTHWSVAGAILAATGTAPEHWLAELMHAVHLPHDALPSSLDHIDYRLVAVIVGLSIIVGDNLWRHHRRREPPEVVPATAPTMQPGLSLPDRPSIAVLPFTNLSGDPEQEYFSDGMADDIIVELSRDRGLFVIARNSSFTYRGRSIDMQQVRRELGVRYIVEGSVRRDAERVRVSAQLIDATSGSHIWGERYNRDPSDIFAVQDEIAAAVAVAIGPAIADAEVGRAIRKPPTHLDAWETYQRGLWHWTKGGGIEIAQAKDFFRRAMSLDPLFVSPRAMLAFVYLWELTLGVARTFRENVDLAELEARKATELDRNDARALTAMSWVFVYRGNLEAALEQAQHAIAVNYNDAGAYVARGNALLYSGRPDEAREALLTAIRLNPRDPFGAVAEMNLAVSYYFERNYASAVEAAERTIRSYPNVPNTYRWLAASLGQVGRISDGQEALRIATSHSPVGFRFFTQNRPPWFRTEDHDHLLEGLRKVGLTDGQPDKSIPTPRLPK